MKWWLCPVLVLLVCCKGKKKEEEKPGSFPVLSYIKSQVAHVDTSLYSIIKVVTVDSTSDTTYIRREDFRKEARDFLELPDIASGKWKDDYTEEKSYDPLLELAVLVYTAKEADATIEKEQVYIQPGNGEEDKVKTLIIDQVTGTTRKNLVWNVDSHFQIVTRTSKEDGSEQNVITKVIWK
ncbi:MAG: hypothetical protein JWP69_1375 [Flaviaesturariibacter sp.]|nr:hypothetical protein [Flaviaesturariibacter sp.]